MKKSDLDKRICDCEEGAINTETYRQFLENGTREIFGDVAMPNLDTMTDEELTGYLDEIDYLLSK